MSECIFCAIIAGDIPGDFVAQTETVVAFRDIAPQAPVHVIVAPRLHVPDVAALAAAAPEVLADMAGVAQRIADDECGGQFRFIFNTGAAAGQTVFHVHGHVMNSGTLGWDA